MNLRKIEIIQEKLEKNEQNKASTAKLRLIQVRCKQVSNLRGILKQFKTHTLKNIARLRPYYPVLYKNLQIQHSYFY